MKRTEGNVLIDVPRWSAPLARRLAAMGGVSAMVLTHRDDVADHQRWAQALGCPRWIHQADGDAAPEAEHQLSGSGTKTIAPGLQLIPTPGHTAGSLCAVLGEARCAVQRDHLWWNAEQQVLVCSKQYCWWNFEEQIRSLEKLQDLDVAWLLPGHGHRHHFPPASGSRRCSKPWLDSALTPAPVVPMALQFRQVGPGDSGGGAIGEALQQRDRLLHHNRVLAVQHRHQPELPPCSLRFSGDPTIGQRRLLSSRAWASPLKAWGLPRYTWRVN